MPRKGEKRAPHKPDCQCVVCHKMRERATAEAPPVEVPAVAVPQEVRLDSLNAAALFKLKGGTHRVAEKTPECIVCHQLQYYDAGPLPTDKGWRVNKIVSLATFTMVRPM